MWAILVAIHGARGGSRVLEANELPYGSVMQQLVGSGFVIFALVIVLVLGYRGGEGRAAIRSNRAKHNRPKRSRNNELGSGDLAVKTQIQRWIDRTGDLDTLLPVKMIKGGDGIALKQGCLVIPPEERNRHILIIAKTGSGKTTRAILPVLFNDCLCTERSTIVLDSKPEMWDKLVGITRKYNPEKRILLFNPLDTVRGLSWNILSKIDTDTDAKLIAQTIISATDNPASKSDSPFFRNNALSLLNSIMVGLLTDPNERLTMPRVHQLINSGMENLCKWIEVHPEALRNSKTFVDLARSGSQNADTIMSEIGMRLSAWDLSAIRSTTALDELDLERLIAEPTLLIIELRESELEMLRPMANVIVVEMLRFLTKRAETFPAGKLPRPIGIVIDEFASALGRLPDIHVKLNTLRSRNVSIFAAIQSIAQIKAAYDRDADSVLAGFSTKIFMPTLDFQDAEWASKESGTMTVRYNLASIGKNKRLIDYFATKNDNTQEQVQQRAVLTPDEIGRPADNSATFFMPNTPVFQGHLVPYFEVPSLTDKLESAKGMDYRLRESPIEYDDSIPEIVATGPSAAQNPQYSPEQAQALLAELRTSIHFESSDVVSKEWWTSLEKLNERNPTAVLNLGQQLIARQMSLGQFYQIYASSGIDNVDELLRSIDSRMLTELRDRLGWSTANQHAKDWWLSFEETNKSNSATVIGLAHELLRRGATIDDFFSTYVHSECNSVPEILALLDQLLIRKQAEVLTAQMGNAAAGAAPHPGGSSIHGAIPPNATQYHGADRHGAVYHGTDHGAEYSTEYHSAGHHHGEPHEMPGSGYPAASYAAPGSHEPTQRQRSGEHRANDGHSFANDTHYEPETPLSSQIEVGGQVRPEAPLSTAGPDVHGYGGYESSGGGLQEVSMGAPIGTPLGTVVTGGPMTLPEDAPLAPNSPTRKQRQRQAAESVHVDSYLEMGRELLSQGKVEDFYRLVELAREDPSFPNDSLPLLEELPRKQ